jgi:hypothetical protein
MNRIGSHHMNKTTGDTTPPSLEAADVRVRFEETLADEDDGEIQLRLVQVLMSSNNAPAVNLEHVLQKLINWFEANDLLIPGIRTRSCLAKYYNSVSLISRGKETLDGALPAMEEHFRLSDSLTLRCLRSYRQVVFVYHDLECHAKCEDVLELTADTLECKEPSHHNEGMIVSFLVVVSNEWQKRADWEVAAPWLERALVNCIQRFGKSHSKTKILEEALKERRFTLGGEEILKFELQHLLDD